MKGHVASFGILWFNSLKPQSNGRNLKEVAKEEFIPIQNIRKSRNRVNRLSHNGRLSSSIDALRRPLIRIRGTSEDKKLDKFVLI